MTGQKVSVCPYLERRGSVFICKAVKKVVYPGLEKCLVDYSNCIKFRG